MATGGKFHLGCFVNFTTPEWRDNDGDPTAWLRGTWHAELAQLLERAAFDFLMLEDSGSIPDEHRDSMEVPLRMGYDAPKLDPLMLNAMLTHQTSRLGLISTLSTSFWAPYLVARTVGTVDQMSGGRAGWNLVTGSADGAAQNYGLTELLEHDERYVRATEFAEVVTGLWDTWEPGAIVADRDKQTYVDPAKVHYLNYRGKYFSSRGPGQTPQSPQGRPVICQAGSSPAGRAFGARWADVILAVPMGIERMKAFRDDVRAQAEALGRDPDSIKIMYIAEPIVAETDEAAQATWDAMYELTPEAVEDGMMRMASIVHHDFSGMDPNAPLPPGLTTNGHQSSLNNMYTYGDTLAEIAVRWLHHFTMPELVGSPATVADRMLDVIDEVGGDGFLINVPMLFEMDYIEGICTRLVPELQRRGRVRTEYAAETLRGHLGEF